MSVLVRFQNRQCLCQSWRCLCQIVTSWQYFDPFQCTLQIKFTSQINKRNLFTKTIKLWQPIWNTDTSYPCKSISIRENILPIARWKEWNLHYLLGILSFMIFDNMSSQLLANNQFQSCILTFFIFSWDISVKATHRVVTIFTIPNLCGLPFSDTLFSWVFIYIVCCFSRLWHLLLLFSNLFIAVTDFGCLK